MFGQRRKMQRAHNIERIQVTHLRHVHKASGQCSRGYSVFASQSRRYRYCQHVFDPQTGSAYQQQRSPSADTSSPAQRQGATCYAVSPCTFFRLTSAPMSRTKLVRPVSWRPNAAQGSAVLQILSVQLNSVPFVALAPRAGEHPSTAAT
jgi:hypothetical protein